MYVCATGDGEARSACLLNGSANTSDSQRRRGDHILGNGVFTESVFSNSWECDVAEKSYYYWLERYYIEEHPLFAFEVEFHDAPFPPQEPLPELHWSDLFDFVFDIFGDEPAPATPESTLQSDDGVPASPPSAASTSAE